ncbi:MAG: hypothetical protein HY302_07420 [Opitutae bacterium]|nr:hypothetical protein [Opitutae bacterium]
MSLSAAAKAVTVDVVDKADATPPPFTYVSQTIVPGDNFRMIISIKVAVKPGQTVTEVDGVCVHTVGGLRRSAPATAAVPLDDTKWEVEFNVPKNPEYYIEIYSLQKGDTTDAKLNKQNKKVKKTKSSPLILEMKI